MTKRSAIIDVETNGLLENMLDYSSFPYKLKESAKLWCVVVRDLETGEEFFKELGGVTKDWLEKTLQPYYYIVAHNGIKFDFITLKLFGILDYKIGYLNEKDLCFGKECMFVDSLILSRLSNPDRFGGHSLKEWGKRVGNYKDDYRQQCIDAGYIKKSDPKGTEFLKYNELMLPYCKKDCEVNSLAYKKILTEFYDHDWKKSIKKEHKLADLAVRRENLGFYFDKDLAIQCVEELNSKLEELANKVEPLLPERPLNKTEETFWTPPKQQTKKDGSLTQSMIRFIQRIEADIKEDGFIFQEKFYPIPYNQPLKTTIKAEMKDMNHIKMVLIDKGWIPSEWSERDITRDTKKKELSKEKKIATLDRWWDKLVNKKEYYPIKFKEIDLKESEAYDKIVEKLDSKYPVRLPTAPKIRVGVEKELCPNLIKLGEKVAFAKDFADWLTYRHRRNSIAGGDLEDLNLYEENPTSGFLATYREVDQRIPTPSIEIGAVTNRYTHINVANIPRVSSVYGEQMRSLFCSGEDSVFLGFDYSSLEARIMAHYVYKYPGGIELGKAFLAEKPDDFHSVMARLMNVPRSEAKSINYGLIYGAQWNKIKKMTGKSTKDSKKLVDDFWNGALPLKNLRDNLIKYWESTGKKYILGIDGRKINVRSKHALLNSLFQSAGVIFAKYVSVIFKQYLEEEGLIIDPFIGKPDVCSMIEYHDEQNLYNRKNLFKFKTFNTKEEVKNFVSNWEGEQLSAIGEAKGKFYVALPNIVSRNIEKAMKTTEELLKLSVPMGYEYMLGNNWAQCH